MFGWDIIDSHQALTFLILDAHQPQLFLEGGSAGAVELSDTDGVSLATAPLISFPSPWQALAAHQHGGAVGTYGPGPSPRCPWLVVLCPEWVWCCQAVVQELRA